MSAAAVSIYKRIYSNTLTHTPTHTSAHRKDSSIVYILLLRLRPCNKYAYSVAIAALWICSYIFMVVIVAVVLATITPASVAKSFMNADDYNDNCVECVDVVDDEGVIAAILLHQAHMCVYVWLCVHVSR